MRKIRMNVFLLERQQTRLEEESERTGSSVAELIRRAIDMVYPDESESRATIGDLVRATGFKLPKFGDQKTEDKT
jgi:hypothetical protein